MKKLLPLLVILLNACATNQLRTVHIDSKPQGARIFFGQGPNEGDATKTRGFIGTTPFDWKTIGDGNGRFLQAGGTLIYSMVVPEAAIFFAEPPENSTNLFAKSQVFHAGALVTGPDKIPEGLFFDLTKPEPKK